MTLSRTPSASRIAADRGEFATRIADLNSNAEWRRQRARKWVEQQPSEQIASHILALWQEEEVRRRRYNRIGRWLLYIGATGVLFILVMNRLCLRDETAWQATRGLQILGLYLMTVSGLMVQAGLFCTMGHFPTARHKGMAQLLLQNKDPQLLGPMLDALSFYKHIMVGEMERQSVRYRLVQQLTSLLTEVGHRDMPPLDAYQRRVLLAEIEQCTHRLKNDIELNDDETAFLIAALGALEREPASGSGQTQRIRRQEEQVLTQFAQASSTAEANHRQVREAAEDCLVRLRVQ